MRIGFDGYPLFRPKTGVGHYTFELVKALAGFRPEHSFELLAPEPFPSQATDEIESITNLRAVTVNTNFITRRWWSVGLPLYMQRSSLDIFHGTNYEVPLWNRGRNIVTVHDLSVFTHADKHEETLARRAQRRLPIMLRAATRIITPTDAVKREVTDRFRIDPSRIAVTPEAPRKSFQPIHFENTAEVRQRFGIENDFILFVGTIEPRKNLPTLVRAFDSVLRETQHRPQLVIAGGAGWLTDELDRFVAAANFGNRLRMTGYLNDDDLRALYSSCKLFAYPSIYEGFGLPPLEAMACGAPVIASRIPALEETLKDNARLVDPLDETQLAKAIIELLEGNTEREHLAKKGHAHAATFSWEQTAKLTLEIYEDVWRGSH
ncbi:MAG TPA: glycosyltransferase family 1 protein [Pyrinomonadaceae bacterium]|nr:glycosyltransferase family 1 protein [Pyrinomonadaceae bacterium]